MMTRKNFENIARILRDFFGEVKHDERGRAAVRQTASDMADHFQDENPRFDRERFFKACGEASPHTGGGE